MTTVLAIDPGTDELPLDVTLCNGAGEPICEDCLRRTAKRPPIGWYMQPTAKDDDCAEYMEPYSYRLTGAES